MTQKNGSRPQGAAPLSKTFYAWVQATWLCPLTSLACGLILLLPGCADKPPIVSADTSCERFRHISATDEQIKVFADNWAVMEPYADQVIAHNLTYDAACLKEPVK